MLEAIPPVVFRYSLKGVIIRVLSLGNLFVREADADYAQVKPVIALYVAHLELT